MDATRVGPRWGFMSLKLVPIWSGAGLFLGQFSGFGEWVPNLGRLGGPGQCGLPALGAYVEFSNLGEHEVVPRWISISSFITFDPLAGFWSSTYLG